MQIYEAARDRYPESERGCCISCGFLAKRQPWGSLWHEASQHERTSGRFRAEADPSPQDFNTRPSCFRHAADLLAEWSAAARGPSGTPEGATTAVINRSRGCQAWYPYSPGFSPKEHFEELRMMLLEEERRENDEALANLQVESQRIIAQIQSDSKEIAKATQSFTTRWTYVAIGVAVLALIAAGVAAAFSALAYLAHP